MEAYRNIQPNGSDNPQEATDGTPAWWTFESKLSIQIKRDVVSSSGFRKRLDVHYKTYSSGNGAPEETYLTLRASLTLSNTSATIAFYPLSFQVE